jgi:hypothetical protein
MGVLNVAWKERRVLVPKEMFASNISPPPNTFLILLVALCAWCEGKKKTGGGNGWNGCETDVAVWGDNGYDMNTYRVALAVSDFGGGLEEETGTFSGDKDDIDVARLCCWVCGGLQTCVHGLEEVSLDEVMTDVARGAEDGFEGRKRVWLREMWINKGCEEGPASVFCAVDTNGGDARVLVEDGGIHDRNRKSAEKFRWINSASTFWLWCGAPDVI